MDGAGGRRAAIFWARIDVRRRWRSLVLVGLLAAVTAGLAMAAVAGARRTDTALERLRRETRAADAVVFPSQVGDVAPDLAPLATRPEVARLAGWDLVFGDVESQPGGLLFAPADRSFGSSVERPVVVRGRMLDPRAPDEVVVDENAAAEAPPVGARFTFQPYAPDQSDTTGAPRGPRIALRVVGVVREVPEFLFVSEGQVFLSPAFLERYGPQVFHAENVDVVLRHGAADVPVLRRDVDRLLVPGTPVLDLHATSRRLDTTLAVERTALLVLGAAIILGGAILLAQVLARSAGSVSDDAAALRGIGATRGVLGSAAALSHALPAAVAVGGALAVCWLASDRFPVGLGRRVDPSVGYHLDWTVLVPGLAVTALGLVGSAALVGRRAGALARVRSARRAGSVLAGLRRRVPVGIGLGTSMALEPGAGRARVPVAPVLTAASVAILGVVATLTIDQGITNALGHPELAGITWDAGVTPDPGALTGRGVTPALADKVRTGAGRGAAIAVADRFVGNVGGVGAPIFSVRALDGGSTAPVRYTLLSGTVPRKAGEAAIGPATARELRVHVGDTIGAGDPAVRVRLVGEALFPDDPHAEFDEGLWLAASQFDALVPPLSPGAAPGPDTRLVVVRFARGTATGPALSRLAASVGSLASDVSPPHPPDELTNMRNIRALPNVLAGFLGLMAVSALSFVLVTSSRRRRREFAVLRAIGMGPAATRLVVSSQGTVVALVGLVLGIPLGLVVGRGGWRVITEHVPLSEVAPLAVLGLVLVVPAALVVANVLALWPGHTVGKGLVPAHELRAD